MHSQTFLRKYCLSAVAIGAMTGALVLNPFSVRGAQAAVSSPLNNWEVTSVESAGKAFSNYCVAANAFDNKTIMIIAYESGQKSSIAFNLQENKFKPKEKYPVTLQFSNGSKAQFVALAENESTLIIQAGTDIVLWENLVQNATLSLTAVDVQRDYSLKQFDFVYSSLNECVGDTARAEDLKNKKSSSERTVSSVDSKILQMHENKSTTPKAASVKDVTPEYSMAMPDGLGSVQSAPKANNYVSKGSATPSTTNSATGNDAPAVKYIRSLLDKSFVVVKTADAAPIAEDDYLRYSWITEQDLKGKFEQVYWPSDKTFHDLTQNYFERNGMSCSSDFMPMTNEPYRVGDMAIADGQAFCMNTDDSVAVAYIFFGIGNTFTAIEHKGRFDQLETALNVRENIRQTLEFIAGGKPTEARPLTSSSSSLPTLQGSSNASSNAPQSKFIKTELPSHLE